MKTWEYLVVSFGTNASAKDVQNSCCEHGQSGWEIVATRPVTVSDRSVDNWLAIFKRETQQPRAVFAIHREQQ